MRVLVADDHSLFRDGIVSLLEAAGHQVIGQATDGREAVDAARNLEPDLVLMDISMPGMNGIEALRQIKEKQPGVQVVMLTVSDDDEDLLEAIQSGASGYLLKNLSADDFLDMLAGLERGEAAITRKTASQLLHAVATTSQAAADPVQPLTPREMELLQLVAEGLANKAIARELNVSPNTVKYHMRNILQKLGVQNRTEAVMTAMQQGLIDPSASA